MTDIVVETPVQHAPLRRRVHDGAKFFYFLVMLAALVGGGFSVLMFFEATGAPQEGAAAAFGCLCAVVPYVVARSIDAMTQ